MTARDQILGLITQLPDATTYADAFAALRPLYNLEVAPIIAQYGNPPRPHGQWRRHITGIAEGVEQKSVCTSRAELLGLMQLMPADATPAEAVDEALYKLVLSYSVEKASQQIAEGMGISHEDVKRSMANWTEEARHDQLN